MNLDKALVGSLAAVSIALFVNAFTSFCNTFESILIELAFAQEEIERNLKLAEKKEMLLRLSKNQYMTHAITAIL